MTLLIRDARSGKWRVFERPLEIIAARSVDEVVPALAQVEAASMLHQRHAAGFVSYEAASAFDSALDTKRPDGFPLLWFGVYEDVKECALEDLRAPEGVASDELWKAAISNEHYARVFEHLQELIRNGDTYQINYTYRLEAHLQSDPYALFLRLAETQNPPFGAFVDIGDWVICSASPELFFHRCAGTVESRPMKGTAARGLWFEQDLEHATELRTSEKERAENVMIVDMVRNDLGRIAKPGTVRVTNLFVVERYQTALQLTSTVAATTDASLLEVMRALFPAASITGAPKSRTMRIIAEVESSPRRIYTGTIGFVEPGGRAQFNVAIRTVLVNRGTGEAEYGVGGGIVSDSVCADEWEESRIKARALAARPSSFDLLETLLWTPENGYVLLGRHLTRLLQSADYFGFRVDVVALRDDLQRYANTLGDVPNRVRLTLSRRGAIDITSTTQDVDAGFSHVALAADAIDPGNPFLYHKTTNREVYEHALAGRPGFTDVLLYNDRDEITESTIANFVVAIDGELLTPPVACGLLPGTLRAHLLDEKKIREEVIGVQRALDAEQCYLLNSVRGFHPVAVAYKSVIPRLSL